MRVILAYIFVVALWSTTPLAIQWSSQDAGFLFGITSRMLIGTLCFMLILLFTRTRLIWHKKACLTYVSVAIQIYGAMMAVYWASQFIPSGWVSVVAGIAPLLTACITALWLRERSLTPGKLCSYGLGLSGMSLMFASALPLGTPAVLGIAGVILSSLLQSLSAVWIKVLNAKLPAQIQVTGGLLIALPCYLLTWYLFDGSLPTTLSLKGLWSIAYLGFIATTAGFTLYYFLLTKLSATQVAFISLLAPVLALIVGHLFNHEPFSPQVILGTTLILTSLFSHTIIEQQLSKKRTR